MSSLFTTTESVKIKGFAGKDRKVPFYLQFVPGTCIQIATSADSMTAFGNEGMINTILALPHITNDTPKRKADVNNSDRYIPLLRGIVDVPAKGDPVLLCTIGGIKYYLGPLNTDNNPNWNKDNLLKLEKTISDDFPEVQSKIQRGESLNFKKTLHNRLGKIINNKLDNFVEGESTLNEVHGDLMLEGRHGNSIRVGSRDVNPYIFISNGRSVVESSENILHGSLISITQKGSLRDHFGKYVVLKGTENVAVSDANASATPEELKKLNIIDELPGFILASDSRKNEDGENLNKRMMSNIIKSVNQVDDITPLIYDYGNNTKENQIFLTSDRIIFNSRNEDIYLSSMKDIHIGTGRHLTMSTKENLIIESRGVMFGDPNKESNKDKMEPMVLGNALLDILKETLGLLKQGAIFMFAPAVFTDLKGKPLAPEFIKLEQKLDKILSHHHFIEPNTKK